MPEKKARVFLAVYREDISLSPYAGSSAMRRTPVPPKEQRWRYREISYEREACKCFAYFNA